LIQPPSNKKTGAATTTATKT